MAKEEQVRTYLENNVAREQGADNIPPCGHGAVAEALGQMDEHGCHHLQS